MLKRPPRRGEALTACEDPPQNDNYYLCFWQGARGFLDQFNEIRLRNMTRMEAMMIALTKGIPNVQTNPTTNDLGRVDLKDHGNSNPRKDKGKGIIGETLKKTPSTKQQKKSKVIDQP
uniref:Uncharacterized protein n=1 Tax=Cannabis sativa TaxID=3483 RepID=A0A803Q5V3_CANSA